MKKGTKRTPRYGPEIQDEICNRIAEGEPLRQICRDEHMPSWTTVYAMAQDDGAFAERIARARELGADAIAEEVLEIIDDGRNDWMERFDEEGNATGRQANGEHIQRSKLRAEMRLKLLAKWSPKKYGDSTKVELAGHLSLGNMSDEEMRAELALLAKPLLDGGSDPV
jgi:hypothetical protein